jgi:hypothetical protein
MVGGQIRDFVLLKHLLREKRFARMRSAGDQEDHSFALRV